MVKKLFLTHGPTPLWHSSALDALVGTELWVKRDDMSSGAAAGNKIRKLEYLLAAALAEHASAVLTCGGAQSNHARATALLAREVGLRPVLLLRTPNPAARPEPTGNLLLDRMAGAEIRYITPEQYRDRERLLAETKADLEARGERTYVIPEGGSNGLGSLGYVDAMREIRAQLDAGLAGGIQRFDAVVHACGSGGTTAGIALGAQHYDVGRATHAMAVCDDRAYFENVVARIFAETRALRPELSGPNELVVHDAWKGPAYGVMSDEQLRFLVDVSEKSGLVLDPSYTGKALFGLSRMQPKPPRALFVHTGGLPGLLAQSQSLAETLGPP
jgi:D-cysteine desulfhydrase